MADEADISWMGRAAQHMVASGQADDQGLARLAAFAKKALPTEYVRFVKLWDGAEGWVGDQYVALWPVARIIERNEALVVRHRAPGFLLFGTDGAGEAFGFDLQLESLGIARLPLVGLARDLALPVATTFGEWLQSAATRTTAPPPVVDRLRGMNIYERQPIIFGGDPVDPANKATVTIDQLIDIAAWWNLLIETEGIRARDNKR